jgi:hypothetical protein
MFTKTFLTTRVTFAHTVAILALGVSLFMFHVPFTNAASAGMSNGSASVAKTLNTAELQTLLAQLQNQLRELNTSVPSTSSQFTTGMSVEITDTLRVRNSASIEGRVIGTQRTGAKGVVIEGPIRQGGLTWVKVDYETGPDGWNAAGWLKNRTSPSNPVDGTFTTVVSDLKATVSFTLSNGCGGYVISWGDDAKTVQTGAASSSMCTMAIVNVTKEHTYAKAGTYTVKVERFNGATRRDVSEKQIKIGTETKLTTPGVINCTSGLESYNEGTKRTSIVNTNGSQSIITDGYYVCRGGKWVVEGSLPKPATSTTPVVMCLSGIVKYAEGTKLQTITENGQTRTIADASFVCRGGKWVIEGSLPKPVRTECNKDSLSSGSSTTRQTTECLGQPTGSTTPGSIIKKCRWQDKEYAEGAVQPNTSLGSRPSSASLAPLTCQNGEWKAVPKTQGGMGSSSSASSTTRNGLVRGASTDIMSEIGITLSTIRSIIAELK